MSDPFSSWTDRRQSGFALAAMSLVAAVLPDVAASANGPAVTGITAMANDASTAASNPAGMARLRESEWMGDVVAFISSSTFESSAPSAGFAGTDESDGSIFVPSAYYVQPYNDRITFGVSLFVPAGVGQDPGNATAGRYLLDEWTLGYVSLAPAMSYRVNESLSFGVAINLNYSAYSYETAVFNGPDLPDGRMELEDSDFGLGFQLGLLYELSPASRLGLSYRSGTDSEFSDTPSLSNVSDEREAMLGLVRTTEIELESEFPQVLTAGAYHELPNGTSITADVVWMDFSEFGLSEATLGENSVAVRNGQYDDIWAASVGVNWPLDEDWLLRFGIAYASSGVEDENRSFAFRLDRILGAGVGAEYRWGEDRVVGMSLTWYDLGEAPVSNDVPLVGSVSGEYSDNYAIGIGLSLRWIRR